MSYLLFLSFCTFFSYVYGHAGHHQSRDRLDGIIMTLDAHVVTSLNPEQQQMHGMFTGGLLTHHFASESFDFGTVGAIHAAYEEIDDDGDDDKDDDDDDHDKSVPRNESSISRRLTHLRIRMSSYAAMSTSTPINTGDWGAHPLLASKVSTGFKSTIVTDSKRSWDGIDYGTNGINQDPSDPAGAAGTTQYVHMVNSNIIIYDKVTGAVIVPAKKTIEYWPSTGICGTSTLGDGTVLFDRIAHRWILSHFAYVDNDSYHCLAISRTDDARLSSGYYYYAIKYSNEFADYPKVSIFGSSYVITSVAYTAKNGGSFLNSKVCALDRDKMVIGTPLTGSSGVICSYGLTNAGGSQAEFHFIAADVDSPSGPAPNAPIYLVSATGYAKEIRIYAFHVDFAAKTGVLSLHTTVISSVGQVRPCSQSLSSTGACVGSPAVDETSTSTSNINGYTMDALADYTMYRIAYRYNAVTGVQTMLVVNNMEVAYQKNSNFAIIGTRWSELRATGVAPGSWSMYQQGQIPDPFRSAFDYQSCWTGSIAMDRVGSIAIGCTASGHILSNDATPIKYYPNVQVSFRPSTRATLNAVDSPIQIQAGGASYINNQQRWGDYSMMTVDPVDDCRFWYATQYIPGGQTATAWRSYITSFLINGCNPATSPAMNPPNPAFATPGTSTQTNFLTPGITGDPQFIGFHGQSYQVHGIPGMYFNILTSKYMQCNGKFEYLGTRPTIRLNHTSTTGWTHPGTYITNLAIKIGSHRLLITSGDAHKGWSMVGINRHRIPLGMKLSLNVTVDGYDGEQSIHYLSSHQIILNLAQLTMILHQSEGFINYQANVTTFGWDSTKSIAPMHGLLGQTWENKKYHTTFRYIEGTSDDYAVTSPFGNDFLYNRFPDDNHTNHRFVSSSKDSDEI